MLLGKASLVVERILLVLAGLLAFIALIGLFYVWATYTLDNGNSVQLLLDASSLVKIGAISGVCVFLSYLFLLLAVIIDKF